MTDSWLSAKETARLLGLSAGTLANWRMNGRGPRPTLVGRTVRYSKADIHEWMELQRQDSPPHLPPSQQTQDLIDETKLLKQQALAYQTQTDLLQQRINALEASLAKLEKEKKSLQHRLNDQTRTAHAVQERLEELGGLFVATWATNGKKQEMWQVALKELRPDKDGDPYFTNSRGKQWWLASTLDELEQFSG